MKKVPSTEGEKMYTFVSETTEQTTEKVQTLIESLLELENMGEISDEDVDECIYYLQKVTEITGLEIDFNNLNDEYNR